MKGLIGQAIERAEIGISKLRFFAPTNKYANDELYEAWDQLQASAENIRAAMIQLGYRDPRS